MAQYADKEKVGASTADDIMAIAELQSEDDNNHCVRLTDEQVDAVVQELDKRKICSVKYFSKGKSLDRSYGDLYVSRVKDKGYVWVLILFARLGMAECNVEKYADYIVQKGDCVAKSDIIALSASYEKLISDFGTVLSASCVSSTDLNKQNVRSYFGSVATDNCGLCIIENPTDSSTGYQRLHPDFKYAYLKEIDYINATNYWKSGKKIDLNSSCFSGEMKMLVEKIRFANEQLLSTVYEHSKKAVSV